MTDDEIARQIGENPDVAPDKSEALRRREFVRVHTLDVAGIRARTGLSQRAFAERFRVGPDKLQLWERWGGVPSRAARTLLELIRRELQAVTRAVAAIEGDEPARIVPR